MAHRGQIVARMEAGQLVPAAWGDRQELAKVEDGQLFTLTKYRPRSDRQNRYLHALLKKGAENAATYWPEEKIKAEVKLANGWIAGARVELNGVVYASVRSTADFNMEEMKLFIQQAKDYILTTVCPGMDETELEREVEADIAPTGGRR